MNQHSAVKRAVILAAGRGKRLGALTARLPKPMLSVAGKPVLERIVLGLQGAGIHDFLFVVGYRAQVIEAYFGGGEAWGAKITYVHQPQPQGTGAALALARDYAQGEPVLATYGDILTAPAHYRALVADYKGAPCAGVIGINPMPDPTAGAAVYREGNRITRVVEKPPPGTAHSRWNVAGVSVYGAPIWEALAGLKPSPRGEYELTDAIEALIESGQEVRAVELNGFWSDIGTPEALKEAEEEMSRKESQA